MLFRSSLSYLSLSQEACEPGFIVTCSILWRAQLRLRGVSNRAGMDTGSLAPEPVSCALGPCCGTGRNLGSSHHPVPQMEGTPVLGAGGGNPSLHLYFTSLVSSTDSPHSTTSWSSKKHSILFIPMTQ